MDAVKLFNDELSSLYESKPPISKAKMTVITRTAMKAIKFYKHVVQSVEKFIQKCKPEYKVPGLYVIDSIVRQSRHQHTDKDVFAPRFARNIQTTFLHLFNCSPEDKSKIVRVLNLWQKNNVFPAEVIQPLLDLAAAVAARDTSLPSNGVPNKTPPPITSRTPNAKNSPAKDPAWLTAAASKNSLDSVTLDTKIVAPVAAPKVKMDKKLFEYDYGEDEDDDGLPVGSPKTQPLVIPASAGLPSSTATTIPNIESLSSILSNPEVLRQLHNLQQQMAARQQQQEMEDKMRRLQEMKHQEEEFDRHLAQTVPNLPFAAECDFKPSQTVNNNNSGGGSMGVPPPSASAAALSAQLTMPLIQGQTSMDLPLMVPPPPPAYQQAQTTPYLQNPVLEQPPHHQHHNTDFDERQRHMDVRQKDVGGRIGSENESNGVEVIDLVRSPSREDSEPRRPRRRSRSRGRRSRSRSRRNRSRSKERDDRDWDNGNRKHSNREMERERERERRKKGLPPTRKNHLTVCSTTLWVGHLSKLTHEDQLSNIFGEYGDIVSINVIPPRGCAFVCMNRRQDALRALHALKYFKIQNKSITVAWAPGKGMKDKEWKDYWEVDVGASFFPYNKLSEDTDFELLEDGGMIDQETFPEWLKDAYYNKKRGEDMDKSSNVGGSSDSSQTMDQQNEVSSGSVATSAAPSVTSVSAPPTDIPTPPQPPPPLPPPMGILPPPPFPMQTRLLPPMGMPMGGLVGNVPLPPPLMVPTHQMLPRMPPPFTSTQFGGLDKRDSLLGVPPPPMAATTPVQPVANPFSASLQPPGVAAPAPLMSTPYGDKGANKDLIEMDVDDLDEDEEKSNNFGPVITSSMGGRTGGGLLGDAPPSPGGGSDTDMRHHLDSSRDPASFSRHQRPPDRRGRSPAMESPHGCRPEDGGVRPPLLSSGPLMPPHFDHHPPHHFPRQGGRGREEDEFHHRMMDFSPPHPGPRGGGPPPPPFFRGGAGGGRRHPIRPQNGPMFGPRMPGMPPMGMRPHRPIGGMRGGDGGRGGFMSNRGVHRGVGSGGRFERPNRQEGGTPRRSEGGERRSRWSAAPARPNQEDSIPSLYSPTMESQMVDSTKSSTSESIAAGTPENLPSVETSSQKETIDMFSSSDVGDTNLVCSIPSEVNKINSESVTSTDNSMANSQSIGDNDVPKEQEGFKPVSFEPVPVEEPAPAFVPAFRNIVESTPPDDSISKETNSGPTEPPSTSPETEPSLPHDS